MNTPKKFFRSVKPQTIALRQGSLKFPSISQIFPEMHWSSALTKPLFLTAFLCGFLCMVVGIVAIDINANLGKLQEVKKERLVLAAQAISLNGIIEKYSGYRDGYYQLGAIEYRLGNPEKAYRHLQKAISIDSEFVDAKNLLEKIAGK